MSSSARRDCRIVTSCSSTVARSAAAASSASRSVARIDSSASTSSSRARSLDAIAAMSASRRSCVCWRSAILVAIRISSSRPPSSSRSTSAPDGRRALDEGGMRGARFGRARRKSADRLAGARETPLRLGEILLDAPLLLREPGDRDFGFCSTCRRVPPSPLRRGDAPSRPRRSCATGATYLPRLAPAAHRARREPSPGRALRPADSAMALVASTM